MEVICWTLIGVCVFYLIRCVCAGYFLYPTAQMISKHMEPYVAVPRMRKTLGLPEAMPTYRNFYLFVLNPFWWNFIDTYREKEWRGLLSNDNGFRLKFKKNKVKF